ncbi:MAG: glycosyltransferase [Gammaproteobacteria bacterium]|nr:glycosyltransferase [Gammaproteobacteria bacterium]
MKRCLLITTSYPSRGPAGGEAAGAFVRDFAQILSKHIEVTVVAPALQAGTEQDDNVKVVYFLVPRMPLSLLSPLRPIDWWPITLALKHGAAAARREAGSFQPQHILAFWTLPGGFWAKLCARALRIPYSVWALGSDIWTLGKIPLVRGILRRTLREAKHCYADGEQLRRDVELLSGRSCDFLASARMLPCPKRSRFATQAPYKLAFLGRWHENKGADILMETLLRLNDEDWRLIDKVRIGGGGPLANVVEQGVRELQSAGRSLELHGFMGRQDAAELLGWADWLMIPSRIESIPVIFSDALQAGCPMLATPVGDLVHLVESLGVGLCARSADSEGFTELLKRGLRTSPGQFSSGIVASAQKFNVAESARRFLRDAELGALD